MEKNFMISCKRHFQGSPGPRAVPDSPLGPPPMPDTVPSHDRHRWLTVVLGFVAIEATAYSLRGALVPRFVEVFDTTSRVAGLLAPAATAGFVLTLVCTGLLVRGTSTRRLLAVATAVTGLCFVGAALAPSFGVLLVALFGRGVATGVVRGLDRPLLSTLYEGALERVYNYYDLAWATGAALAPGLGVLAVGTVGWRPVYVGLALGCFAVAALAATGRLPLPASDRDRISWRRLRALAATPRVRRLAVAMFLLGGVEGGLFTWLPLYATRHVASGGGATALTLLVVTYVPGRFLHAALAARADTDRYLVGLATAGTAGLAGTLAAAGTGLFLPAVAATGLVLSGLFPTIIAAAVDAVSGAAGPLNAVLTAIGYLGIAVWPPLAGHVAYVSDLSLLAVPAVLCLPLAGALHHSGRAVA